MKSSWLVSVLSLATSISAQKSRLTTPPPPSPIPTTTVPTIPFDRPLQAAEPQRRAFEVLQILNKRVANDCPSGYNPCSTLDNPKICCRNGSRCARDAADNIACCPTGASCTGSLSAATTDTSSFRFPQYGTAAPTTTADETSHGAIATGSTMPGEYPFVYVPTTFSDAKTCSAYYTRCETDYASCTASLGNGGNAQWGVTGAAGVTVQGGSAAQETGSTCSSLQLEACHGLNLGYCDSYHSGKQDSENAGVPGRAVSSPRDLVFGLAVAVAGMLI